MSQVARTGSFNLVVCQFGLMFFTDQHKALTEMHRVLRAGGRVVVSVWQSLDRHPFYQTLHEVSRRHLGKSSVQAVFSLGDSDELRRLLIEAGFQHVEIEPASMTARFSNPEAFLAWEIDVDPAETPALQHLDATAQQEILTVVRQDMLAALHAGMLDGQVVLEYHALIAQARR